MAFHCSPLLPKRPQDERLLPVLCRRSQVCGEKRAWKLSFPFAPDRISGVGLWSQELGRRQTSLPTAQLPTPGSEQQHRVPTCISIAAGRAVRASCSQPTAGRKAQVPCLGLGEWQAQSQMFSWQPGLETLLSWGKALGLGGVWEGAWSHLPSSAGPTSLS